MKRVENQYITKPEDGIVICKRKSINDDFIIDEVRRNCSPGTAELLQEMCYSWRKNIPLVDIASKYVGVAKCDSRDTFDEKTGRDVARLISLKKYHAAASKRYFKLYEFLRKAAEEIGQLAIIHNTNYVETCSKLKEFSE